jgi:hypothetical protein
MNDDARVCPCSEPTSKVTPKDERGVAATPYREGFRPITSRTGSVVTTNHASVWAMRRAFNSADRLPAEVLIDAS